MEEAGFDPVDDASTDCSSVVCYHDGNTHPSDLPEVVVPNYPISHAYIRPHPEPGEATPKYLAYDQTGLEPIPIADIVSPTSPAPPPPEPDKIEESEPSEKSPPTVCGFPQRSFWISVLLAFVVVAGAVGGGVGGGIAASTRAQHTTATTTSSTSPTPTSSTTSASTSDTTQVPLSDQVQVFSFQAYADKNYGGTASDIFQSIGAFSMGFNASSYIWQPNGSGCCVTFCQVKSWVGWWCDPQQQLSVYGRFDNVVIGCVDETEEASDGRCA
ncbi:hypothetical protein BX600DRAFT_511692 [Xylariales sp. PMI_506]|nr:hypothetical protein BX600DRAFT_511692 [Xylariales sp. PMI_506]